MTQILLLLLLAALAPSRVASVSPDGPEMRLSDLFAAPSLRHASRRSRAPGDPAPLSAAATRKAEAMLRDRLPCLGCHTLNGSGGRAGPDLSSVRTRRSADYIAAIVSDPAGVVPAAAMPRTLMPSATRDLIVRYLQTRPGDATGGVPTAARVATPTASPGAPTAATPDGAALYSRWCATCHGVTGKGDGANAPSLPVKPTPHADQATMSQRPDDSLYDAIAGGGAIMNRSPRMPAFGASLSPSEIRALVAHIRTLCRCQGPAWSRDGGASR